MQENRKRSYFDGQSPHLKRSSRSLKSLTTAVETEVEFEIAIWRTDHSFSKNRQGASFSTPLAPSNLEQHLETDLFNYNIHLESIPFLFGMKTLGSMQKYVIIPFSSLLVAKEPKFNQGIYSG